MNLKNLLIAKNASILLITDILSKILLTVLSIIIARKLGASDLGLLKYAISFSGMFSFIPNAGFKAFINREVAKYPDKSGIYFSNLSVIKLFLCLITFVIIFISSYLMQIPQEQLMVVCVAALIMLLDSYIQFYTAFFRGFQKAKYEAWILISQSFFVATTGILIISLGYGIINMLIIRFLVTAAIFIAGFFILKINIIRHPFTITLSFCRNLIWSAFPFTILTVLVIVNAHIGIVLLTHIKGTLYTGWYTAALSLCGIFQFIPASVAGAILPAMTKLAKENNNAGLEFVFSKSIKYLMIFVLPIAAGTALLADKLILVIYSGEFINSILTLRILIWIIVLSFTNSIFNVAFSSIDKERKFVRIQIIGTISNISFCLFLIPVLGHNGLAIAVIFSQLIVFLIAGYYISKYYKKLEIKSFIYKLVIAVFLMVSSILLIISFNLFIIIFIAMMTYGASLFLLKVFDSQEIDLIKIGLLKTYQLILQRKT